MPNGAHPGRRDEQAPAASGLAPGIQLRAPTLPGPRPCCDAACGVPAGSDERRATRSIGACRRPKRFAAIRCGVVTFFVPNEKKMRRAALRSEAYVRVCASAVAKGLRWPSGGTRAGANRRGAHSSAGGAASTRRSGAERRREQRPVSRLPYARTCCRCGSRWSNGRFANFGSSR